MRPAFSLARRKLADARTEFDQLVQIEAEVIPALAEMSSKAGAAAITSLRASGIESVYTSVEGVLKEALTVVDGGVFSAPEGWHAQLLAQAASPNERAGRPSIISERTYDLLNRLRSFRHVARNVYRHLLRDTDVQESLCRLTLAFPLVEAEVSTFLDTLEQADL